MQIEEKRATYKSDQRYKQQKTGIIIDIRGEFSTAFIKEVCDIRESFNIYVVDILKYWIHKYFCGPHLKIKNISIREKNKRIYHVMRMNYRNKKLEFIKTVQT